MRVRFIPPVFSLFLCLFGPAVASNAAAAVWDYDPGEGTLPEEQGFVYEHSGESPDPYVAGGVLHQGPTDLVGYQGWALDSIPSFFDFTEGFCVEWTMKVISSNFDPTCGSNVPRAGYNVLLFDRNGRLFNIWIAADRVFIHNTNNTGSGHHLFDATDGFHQYRFVVADSIGSLYLDGNPTPDLVLGLGPTGTVAPTPKVFFGDGSICGECETELSGFTFTYEPVCTAVGEEDARSPRAVRLLPASPNPFNPSTTLPIELDRAAEVFLSIHDVTGRMIAVPLRGSLEAGRHLPVWDGTDRSGRPVASGSYFARLRAGGVEETRKLLLIR